MLKVIKEDVGACIGPGNRQKAIRAACIIVNFAFLVFLLSDAGKLPRSASSPCAMYKI